jgi:hypothetical protein
MIDLEKTNAAGLMRDKSTGAIINTNESEYLTYREQVARAKEVNSLKNQVDDIRGEVSEIKDMLKSILQAVKNG